MIARIWKGITLKANANAYKELLRSEIFPGIKALGIKGLISISLLQRELQESVEFVTIMKFENLECVKDFVGEDINKSYVPAKAKQLLLNYDKESKHYTLENEKTN